jgi:putative FmdB family regulatory protein
MPLYEYHCDACGHRFEIIQRFSDPPVETCPTCGGAVRKLLSSPAIQFKGSGWYVTDYARKGSEPKADSSSSTAGEKKADGAEKKADSSATTSTSPSTSGTAATKE